MRRAKLFTVPSCADNKLTQIGEVIIHCSPNVGHLSQCVISSAAARLRSIGGSWQQVKIVAIGMLAIARAIFVLAVVKDMLIFIIVEAVLLPIVICVMVILISILAFSDCCLRTVNTIAGTEVDYKTLLRSTKTRVWLFVF